MWPRLRSIIAGSTALVATISAVMLVSTVRVMSSSVLSASGAFIRPNPALFTSTSMGP